MIRIPWNKGLTKGKYSHKIDSKETKRLDRLERFKTYSKEKIKEEILNLKNGIPLTIPLSVILPYISSIIGESKIICSVCGKEFFYAAGKKKYCSPLCSYIAVKLRYKKNSKLTNDNKINTYQRGKKEYLKLKGGKR